MSASTEVTTASFSHPKNIVRMLIGGLLGAGIGFGCMRFSLMLGVRGRDIAWSDFLSIWLGIVLIGLSVVIAFVSSNRRRLAESLEGERAELPATNEEVSIFRTQAVVLGLAGIMLLAPLMAMGPMRVHQEIAKQIAAGVYVGIVLLFALQTVMNIRTWRRSDEYMRRAMEVTGALTFAIGQGALFLWGAAERLKLAPVVSSWTVVSIMMTLYLAVSGYVALKQRC